MLKPHKLSAIQYTAESRSNTSRILICQEGEVSKENKTRSLVFFQENGQDRVWLGSTKGSDGRRRIAPFVLHVTAVPGTDSQMGIRSNDDC